VDFLKKVFEKLKKAIKRRPEKGIDADRLTELDKKLVFSLSKSRVPSLKQLKYLKKYLNPKELLILQISLAVLIVSTVFVVSRFYITHLEEKPIAGGEYIEGMIGAPKYINPLYSGVNDPDSDIAGLVYSSLFKRSKDGILKNDLVEGYTISEDKKTYTIKIKQGVKWHDGADLRIDDIVFTFNAINSPKYKSPLRESFVGVSIEKVNEEELKFVLTDPYAAFLELLTFGIMPAEKWYQIQPESVSLAELNLKPIGSGPYRFKEFSKDKTGSIKDYKLVPNQSYYGDVPLIDISFKFYNSVEEEIVALNEGEINGVSFISLEQIENISALSAYNLHKLNLPHLTVAFLNQESELLKEKKVRQALAHAVNKEFLVNDKLHANAKVIDGPILPNNFAYNANTKKYAFDVDASEKLLIEAEWEKVRIDAEAIQKAEQDKESEDDEVKNKALQTLSLGEGSWRKKDDEYLRLKIATIEREENILIVEEIKNNWEKIGVKVDLEIVSGSLIQTEIIQPRNFDVLFFGQVVGADPDPYAFWHSTQINEAGYNIANYNNKDVDELLEEARLESDKNKRIEKYKKFQEIIAEDVPAIFMYSPIYIYLQSKKINNFDIKDIITPSDRFNNIEEWYLKTGKRLIWN